MNISSFVVSQWEIQLLLLEAPRIASETDEWRQSWINFGLIEKKM